MGEEEEDLSRDGWTVRVNQDMRPIGTTKDEGHNRTGWRRPQLKRGCIEFKYYADAIHSGLTPPG